MNLDAPAPAPMDAHERDKAQANSDVEDILALRRFPPFSRYFLRRLNEKIEPITRDLLENRELTAEALRDRQTTLAVYREIARMLDHDEIGNRSIAKRPFPET